MSIHDKVTTAENSRAPSPSSGEDASAPVNNEKTHVLPNGEKATTDLVEFDSEMARAGDAGKFHKLSWLRLTSVMIVEAIALGSLSMPASFATLGLVPALLIVIGMGIISYICSIHIGRTWLANREMTSYPMAGELLFVRMFGEGGRKAGRYFTTTIFLLLLIFTTGSHALTGRLMFNSLSNDAICSVGFSAISAVILFLLALPKTFNEMGWLGYVDFASIVIAIIITIIGSGIEGSNRPGGLAAVDWHAINPEAPTFASAFLAVTNITFAYAYAQCQFSFMTELKRPREYTKSVGLLVGVEMVIYCLTGSLIYRFSGDGVKSPALLGLSPTLSKVAFGVAIPVIFISGSINSVTAGRFIYDWKFKGTRHELINTPKGNVYWVAIIAVITIIAWLVAELIPIFSALLGLISSAFISFFSYTFPALFYIYFLREGAWNASKRNMIYTALNVLIAVGGLFIVVAGIYASAIDIKEQNDAGTVGKPFSCSA